MPTFNDYLLIITMLFGYSFIALFISTHIHEYSHYLVGRTQSSDVDVEYMYFCIPHRVWYHKPYDLSPFWTRLAGAAPLISASILTALFGIRWGVPATINQRVVHISVFFAGILSPSDLLAIFLPEDYRRKASEKDEMAHLETLRYVFRQFF